ncbi:MAG: hypothetical protein ACRERE_23725 [Candidatus Entotheonellia bacterium]
MATMFNGAYTILDKDGSYFAVYGTGPGEDKLVAIADFGDPVKVVVFWADAIPADFAQKSGTKSRRIADQVSVRMGSRGTIESSFVGFGNGFVAYNQTPPHPIVEDGPAAAFTSMLTLGVTRPAPTGMEKFVWNKAERKLASVWVDRSVPMLVTVPTYNLPTQSLYIAGARDGVFGVYQLDWETGRQTGYIDLGRSHKFNVLAGLAVPFGEGRVWLTGAYGPVFVRVR